MLEKKKSTLRSVEAKGRERIEARSKRGGKEDRFRMTLNSFRRRWKGKCTQGSEDEIRLLKN